MIPGVAFTPPPASLLAQAHQILEASLSQLPPDVQGAIVGLATETGWNAAVVHRIGNENEFAVAAWIGKQWIGKLTGGTAIRATW